MKPKPFQEELSELGIDIIKKHAIVYLSMEERTGKTLTGILICEKIDVQSILIVTKRKAYRGWQDTLEEFKHEKSYQIITYGMLNSINSDHYDLVILDEAHNYISSYPKPSKTWIAAKRITRDKPIIYMSATPYAQGLSLIYHQLSLSTWSPFRKYSTFYNWFRAYGREVTIKLHNRTINQYHKTDEKMIHICIDDLFISRTRKQLGFPFEPKDKLHYIEPSEYTKNLYNTLLKDKVLYFDEVRLLADSKMRFRALLHMLEGGTFKTNNLQSRSLTTKLDLLLEEREKLDDVYIHHYYFNTESYEKIMYILNTWGDTKDLAIMYNYKGEEKKLHAHFKKAEILQATAFAEGIELSQVRNLVIYSQDFSTARHTQRRARQASMHREFPIIVHYLIIKEGISEQVYKTVSRNKRNYVDEHFKRTSI